MVADIAILVLLTLCQGATGYWAFHMSVDDKRARWGFAAITFIGVGLIVWTGIRSSNSAQSLSNGISSINDQIKRIAGAANINPNQAANVVADKVIAKLSGFQSQLNQTQINVDALQSPPPDPAKLYQNGNVVADIGEKPEQFPDKSVLFGVLYNAGAIDFTKPIMFQKHVLQCNDHRVDIVVDARTNRFNEMGDVVCSIIGP